MKWLRALLKDLIAEDAVDDKEPDPQTSLLTALQIAQTQYLHFSNVRHALITFLFTASFGFYYVAFQDEKLGNLFAWLFGTVLYIAALCIDRYFAINTYQELQKCKFLESMINQSRKESLIGLNRSLAFTSFEKFLEIAKKSGRQPARFCYLRGTIARIVTFLGWPLFLVLFAASLWHYWALIGGPIAELKKLLGY
jgi:hypothetical protein